MRIASPSTISRENPLVNRSKPSLSLRPRALLGSALASLLLGAALHAQAATPAPATQAAPAAEYRSIVLGERNDAWWARTVVYEIWPRSFKDANGDGSGDFAGIVQKLDYLKDLGVETLWLTPVFEAPSYHGYDFQDFYAVERDYGRMADFDRLIAEAHKRGMKVVLDLVLNHISDQHPWFKKSARKAKGYEDYFLWREQRPDGWGQAWSDKPNPEAVWHWNDTRKAYYYGAFGSSQPDVNLRNPVVAKAMEDLAAFWLKKGVDGFRLDAVRYAIEDGPIPNQADTDTTVAYWSGFAKFVRTIKPDALLVGEAWTGLDVVARYRDGGKGLNAAYDFDFGEIVIRTLNPENRRAADFGTVSSTAIDQGRDSLWANLEHRAKVAPLSYFAPFLTNHDQTRIGYALKDDMARGKIAASLLLTSPGPVHLYYGEEIGLSQARTGDDRYRRAPMQWSEDDNAGFNRTGRFWTDRPTLPPNPHGDSPWWRAYWKTLQGKGRSVEAQAADPNSLLNHYKRLLALRNAHPALSMPEELRQYPVADADVWLLQARAGSATRWVLINLDAEQPARFDTPAALRGEHKDLLTGEGKVLGAGFTLKPGETLIF